MRFLLLILTAPLLWGASYTATQSGNWNASATWGGAGVPGFGDTVTNNQYVVTCPASVVCNIGTVNTTSMSIGDGTHAAALSVNGTLVLRGTGTLLGATNDCTHAATIQLGTGSTLDLDEGNGSNPSGFVIPANSHGCIQTILGTSGDTCTWGTSSPTCPTNITSINNTSANGVFVLDSGSGYGDSITNWNGVAITACGSSTVACYQADMDTSVTSWSWKQLYLFQSSWFGSNWTITGVPVTTVPINIDSTISSGRISGADINFNSSCTAGVVSGGVVVTPACASRSMTNSVLRDMAYDQTHSDPFTAGATVNNNFIDGLATDFPALTSANIAGGSWSYDVLAADNYTCSEDLPVNTAILDPTADHVYSICWQATGIPVQVYVPATSSWNLPLNFSNFIFDTPANFPGAHCFNYAGNQTLTAWPVSMSYFTVLYSPATGYGSCGLTAWSSTCPAAPVTSLTHTTELAGGTQGQLYFCEGASTVAAAPIVSSYQGNIYYDTSAAITARGNLEINPVNFGVLGNPLFNAAQPANTLLPSGTDYNANYLFLPFDTTTFTTACASGCTNSGSPYAVPMTGVAPGAHDIDVNPFPAGIPVRTAYTWAQTQGQAGTYAGFRQVFINAGPAKIKNLIASLFRYINTGNIPMPALWNRMPDGSTIGASQPVPLSGTMMRVAVQ